MGKYLTRATARNVRKRTLEKAMPRVSRPVVQQAPRGVSGFLSSSFLTGPPTKLNPRQRKMNKPKDRSSTELHFGTSDPAGMQQEFGNVHHPAQPWFRSIWLAERLGLLEDIKKIMWREVLTAAKRAKRKAAKDA